MITLKKGNTVMEVATELQASAFLRFGYTRAEQASENTTPDMAVRVNTEVNVEEKVTAPKAEPESEQPVSSGDMDEHPAKRKRRRTRAE